MLFLVIHICALFNVAESSKRSDEVIEAAPLSLFKWLCLFVECDEYVFKKWFAV